MIHWFPVAPNFSEAVVAVFAFNIVPKKKVVISKPVQAMHAEWKELLDEAKLFRYGVSDVSLAPPIQAFKSSGNHLCMCFCCICYACAMLSVSETAAPSPQLMELARIRHVR